ncbi:hypothetical protein CSOJ01_12512 [Colletotrichum sojae]|uniref:Phosphoribosyltransferase domain-containing protein n=1 Tax=Colletotrichum sojae TaxID=2175907 RepID=A0A8H6IUR7_9PEZI|nr:hypothetical protein CSOJ01_12512 [Colletotrichum sojae]
MSQLASPVIDVAESQEVDEIFSVFCSTSSSPKAMQDAVHLLTRHVVSAAMKFDTTLDHTTLIPVLRGGLPMFTKGSDCVIVDWSGRRPFPQAPGDGRLIVLDTVIATGDTVAKLCDELWELSGRRERSVVVMCCYVAPSALVRLSRHLVVQYIVVARRAEGCDVAGYLVPTANGDIGDKLFGEKEECTTDAVSPGCYGPLGRPALLERNAG